MEQNSDKTLEQLRRDNQRLKIAVEEMSVLNDIATAITSTQEITRIVDLIVQKCVKHLGVEQGAVMLLDEEDQQAPMHTMVRKMHSGVDLAPYRLDEQLTGWMLKHRQPLVVDNLEKDGRFLTAGGEQPIRSLLSVPMILKGKMLGLVSVFNKLNEAGFSEEDKRLLSIIAAQSAQIVERARLYQKEQQLLVMREEMRMASEIQMNLMPESAPEVPGYQIAGKTRPAREVGGDYYDFMPMEDGQLAFCLGDVSGKGMPAAMLMANLQATLRGQALVNQKSCDCISRANQLLFRSTDSKKFATLFYGVLDYQNHRLTFCNAGHDNPFLFRSNSAPQRLQTGGVVLGFVEKFDYGEQEVELNSGDLVLIYSDGITEAMDAGENEFGEERLARLVQENRDRAPEELADLMIEKVLDYCGRDNQMDDMTLLILKRE